MSDHGNMKDSEYVMHPVQKRALAAMSPAQRYAQFQALYSAAWDLKAAAIRARHPGWAEEQVQAEVRRIFLYACT